MDAKHTTHPMTYDDAGVDEVREEHVMERMDDLSAAYLDDYKDGE